MNPIYWSIIFKAVFLLTIAFLVERKFIRDNRAAGPAAKALLSIIFLGSILIAGAGWIAVDVAHL